MLLPDDQALLAEAGKKPSFLKDIQFLLIGPAWLISFLYRRFGIPY